RPAKARGRPPPPGWFLASPRGSRGAAYRAPRPEARPAARPPGGGGAILPGPGGGGGARRRSWSKQVWFRPVVAIAILFPGNKEKAPSTGNYRGGRGAHGRPGADEVASSGADVPRELKEQSGLHKAGQLRMGLSSEGDVDFA